MHIPFQNLRVHATEIATTEGRLIEIFVLVIAREDFMAMTAPVAVTLSVITARQSTKQRAPVTVRNIRPEMDVNASPDTVGSIENDIQRA